MTDAVKPGRDATSPWSMPLAAWKDVLVRSWGEAGDDNIGLIAAGVAFYAFLAIVPLLGAIVLSYGLIADTKTVVHDMQALTSVMPGDTAKLVGEQLRNVVETSGSKKGFGLLIALALALFGARSAAGAVVTALNIAYEEKERRGFVAVNLLALAMTAGAVVVAVLATIAIAALGHLQTLLPDAPGFVVVLGKIVTYVALALAGAAGAATLYRYGPSREKPRWVWLTAGSAFAALGWLLLTFGFGLYVSRLGNYNATYGSLGVVVVLLTWLSLSIYILLFGAEINSELEHQTAEDTTRGSAKPLGQRDAWAADHVASDREVGPESASPASTSPSPTGRQASSPGLEYMLSRAVSRVGTGLGAKKVGIMTTGLATLGLGMIRRKGKAAPGLALLALATSFSWFMRENDRG